MRQRCFAWLCAVAGLLAVFLIANHRLVTGAAVPLWDADLAFAPYYGLVADYARAGRLLLWNPWTNAGSPDFAEPQIGALSPVVIIMGAVTGGHLAGFRVYWLLIWFMGGLGIVVLGRHLRAPVWGTSVVALGYLFSGFLVGHAEHTPWLYSVAWFPFLIWRLDVALLSRRWRPAFEAGALWGLSGIAGYPALTLSNGAFALLWAVGRLICSDPSHDPQPADADGRATKRVRLTSLATLVRSMMVMSIVGILVMSPTYVGFLVQGRGFTDRVEPLRREEAIGSNALHPLALATAFSPYLASLPPRTLWEYTDISSVNVYMGAVVLWLATVSLLTGPRTAWRWWLVGVAILAIGLSLGRTLPLRGWLYDLVPATRYFRHPAMFRGYAIFYFAVLALLAAGDLTSKRGTGSRVWRWCVALSGAVLALIAITSFYAVLFRAIEDEPERRLRGQAHLLVVWLGVLGAGMAAGWLGPERRATILPVALVLLAAADGIAAQRLPRTVESRDPARVEAWRQLDARHDESLDLTERGANRVAAVEDPDAEWVSNKNLPLKVAVLRGYGPFESRFHRRWFRERVLRDAATGESRFWFARTVVQVAPSDGAFTAFARRAAGTGAPPLVIHAPLAMSSIPKPGERTPTEATDRAAILALPPADRIPISLRRYRPDELAFDVNAPADGWLLVTDRWAQGWRAMVNGQAVTIMPADFIFRAVPVRSGLNSVHFSYHPSGIPWLVVLSWSILAGIAGWSIAVGPRALRR